MRRRLWRDRDGPEASDQGSLNCFGSAHANV